MEKESPLPNKDPYIALRIPEFRMYLLLRLFFVFGYQIQAVVIGWHVYQLTKNPLSLGFIGLCEAIPAIGIALYGGYIADKSEKTSLLKLIMSGMIICSVVLYIVTLPSLDDLLIRSHLTGVIYLMIFFIGICRGFMGPASFSLMSSIVPRDLYPNSATWNSTGFQLAAIGGPATGGLLYAYGGVSLTFLIVIALFTVSLSSLFFFKKIHPRFVPQESIVQSLSAGIRFVFGNKMMLGAMSLDMFSVFFGGAVALIPVIASEVLKVGPEQFGLMRAAPAIGAVLTMLIMARYSPMNRPWRNLLIAVTGFGVSIICYGLSRNFYLTLVFLFFEGVFDSVSVVIRSTIMQLLTPDDMRGRVSSVNSMFIGSSNEIGAFESGLTAKLMGTVPAVVFGGMMTLAIVGATYVKTKLLVPLGLKDIS